MTPLQALDDKIITALKAANGSRNEKSVRHARLNLAVRFYRESTEKDDKANEELSRIALPGMELGEVLALEGWETGFQNVGSKRLTPVRILTSEAVADRITSRVDETKAVEESAAASQEEDPAHLFEPRPDPQAPAAPKMHPADSSEPLTPYEVHALRKFLRSTHEAELNGFQLVSLTPHHAEILNRFLKREISAKPNNVA